MSKIKSPAFSIMKRIAILGLGLMGGSLGLALKKHHKTAIVAGYARRSEVLEMALKRQVVDEVFEDPAQAVCHADMVILCVPIYTIYALAESCKSGLGSDTIVTDVGSTKSMITKEMSKLLENHSATFIGSHPIAGSEEQGITAAQAELYKDSVVVITPAPDMEESVIKKTQIFWESIGSISHVMSPEEHDKVLAQTSHLPHMMASLLAATVGHAEPLKHTGLFCGTGFRDASRLAEGSPEVWVDIIKSNQQQTLKEMKAFRDQQQIFIEKLEQHDYDGIKGILETSRSKRRLLLEYSQKKI
ncbi:MAG: prephenate dehydrogenase/arogenate dehydrogenase family protein [Kiritimatiellae bacterium]|nr:prephenate dehydrogenase/arogenate dehydrogenase family protein [Kiritimatiellia bacterium]